MQDRWNDREAAGCVDELAELVYLSNLIGLDPSLTQPGGGNSSVKRSERDFAGRDVEVLRVKGSGTDLATIGRPGFTGLRMGDLGFLRAQAEMSDEQMMAFMRACMLDAREPTPSVETPLHSVLPYRFIVHTHDFATQSLTDTERPDLVVQEALGNEAAYVPYVRPGFPLAKAVIGIGELKRNARGLVLGQHGLIAWGSTARACYENLLLLINRAEQFVARPRGKSVFLESLAASQPKPIEASVRRELASQVLPLLRSRLSKQRRVILHLDDSPEALAFAAARGVADLARRGMSTPEHILRCGRVPLVVEEDLAALAPAERGEALSRALARFADDYRATYAASGTSAPMLEPAPRVVLLPGLGLVTAMKDKSSAVVGNLCYRHVMRVMQAAESLGGFRFLHDADAIEFEYWPLELAKLNQPERELSRRVALVTGAASGIGRAIAERFAGEGAHVVLADIDEAAVREATRAIATSCRDEHRARAVVMDAMRPLDVLAAVQEAVLTYGGLDILVCNAGFVQPGPLDQMDEDVWDRHFDVNTKGYFLAAREAARVMKPALSGVMLFNASKGAFAPTVDNSAYASSKAAVAALARNLAAELAPFGIRVNYCNADFVDTPLMRKLIEERAKLKGITAAAQTEEYRRRNLMQLGPIPPSAVAEAALFLVSDRSRFTTGAVLPIDGGIKEAMPR